MIFVGVCKDSRQRVDCLVVFKAFDNRAALEIVALLDFVGENSRNLFAVVVEVFLQVVVKEFFEPVEHGSSRVVHISFRLSGFAEFSESGFADFVVVELFGVDERLEIVENIVGDNERFRWRD